MKTIYLAIFSSILVAASTFAETSSEALAAFRKNLQQAGTDNQLTKTIREALLMLNGRLASSGTRGFSIEMLNEWFASLGVEFPDALRESALALGKALEQERAARVAALEALANESLDGLIQAADEKTVASIADKVRTAIKDGRSSAISEREQTLIQTLNSRQQLLDGWQAVFASTARGASLEALRRLNTLRGEDRDMPSNSMRKLREKSWAMARSLGIISFDEAEKLVRGLVTEALSAESAKVLDSIIQTLHAKQELWNSARELGSAESADMAGRALFFATTWQEYLAAMAAGMPDRVRTALYSLINSKYDVPGLARSFLLELSFSKAAENDPRETEKTRFEQLVATCTTLANLESTLPQLEAATQPGAADPARDNPHLITTLRAINRNYQDAKTSAQPSILPPLTGIIHPVSQELYRQLTVFVLSRQLNLPAKETDTPLLYLRRNLFAAQSAKDWLLVKRVFDAASAVNAQQSICSWADASALTHYFAGMHFEETGVARFAVASYAAALMTGSDFVPLDDLRIRLAKLRSEQPMDYEEGLKIAASGKLPPPVTLR